MFAPMDLTAFRVESELTQAQLAALLTEAGSPATQGLISQWEKGAKVPPERWQFIEEVTGGKVTRADLRPDLWPKGLQLHPAA